MQANATDTTADVRLTALRTWLESLPAPWQFGAEPYALAPASSDASFRRYFRVTVAAESWIVMDAPPPMEDCRPFVHIAGKLVAGGVHAPAVHAADVTQGFLLLSDLGSTTYLNALATAPEAAPALYREANKALVTLQKITADDLPAYDTTLLRRELELFPEWYLATHLLMPVTPTLRKSLDSIFATLIENNLAQPQVFVHRDYHARNLMFTSTRNPGVLDFQDAVKGPITYDLVSLLRDAYVEWPEQIQLDWAIRYWEAARAARLPVHGAFDDFYRDFEWMGLQRHLKVLGIFARLKHRDGKDAYLKDMPLVQRYARRVCERYAPFRPLAKLFAQIDSTTDQSGYSF